MAAPYRVLRVTLNRLPGTFRRHVSTGRHQTRPERAGSASELKPSETNATIAGVLCRRSLLVSTPRPTRLPFLPLRGERERKGLPYYTRTGPSHPPGTMKTLEPGITRSVTTGSISCVTLGTRCSIGEIDFRPIDFSVLSARCRNVPGRRFNVTRNTRYVRKFFRGALQMAGSAASR